MPGRRFNNIEYRPPILKWLTLALKMRDKIVTIGITEKTKLEIVELSKQTGLAQITVLEYLINGKLKL